MKILILNWRDPMHPLAGGAEISLFEHAQLWHKKGAEIVWFSSGFGSAKEKDNFRGITIVRKGSHYTVHIHAFFFFLKHKKTIDLVIDCFHFIPFFSPIYAKHIPIIALINEPAKNNWFKNTFFPLSILGFISEPYFFRFYSDIPFITSALSVSEELNVLGIEKKYIHIIPHGIFIPKNNIPISNRKNALMYLAQISPDKGTEDAIYAFKLFKEKYRDGKLWVVGKATETKYERYIKKLARELGLYTSVTFFGFVSEQKKYELLSKAWVLIHPSVREGWGLTVVEANCVGTVAVGYNVTGLKDSIQHMKTGILTKKNSPEELAMQLIKLKEDPDLYNELSRNARNWSGQFDWNLAGKKSWNLIKSVYENRK